MKKPRGILLAAALLLVTLAALLYGVYRGVIPLNRPSLTDYPVRGVDVSHYQGEIDWQILAGEAGLSFAFIKATEGSSFVDPRFAYNYAEAQKTDLRVGAYHFFSFDSAGKTQAAHFIGTVKKTDGMLPPVIDLEFYGDKAKNPPEAEDVRQELRDMIDLLREHYGVQPILYVTKETYTLYVAGHFADCDIWYRNVLTAAGPTDGRVWTFWQYTNRGRLSGYAGEEPFIDLNVFAESAADFARYGLPE